MPTSPLAIVQAAYAAFAARDMPALFALLAPEVELAQSDQLPWGGRYEGIDGARRFLARLTTHIQSSVEIERTIEAGDTIVAIGWTKGFVNATGKPFRVPFAHVWTIRDEHVVQVRYFIDNPAMLAAL